MKSYQDIMNFSCLICHAVAEMVKFVMNYHGAWKFSAPSLVQGKAVHNMDCHVCFRYHADDTDVDGGKTITTTTSTQVIGRGTTRLGCDQFDLQAFDLEPDVRNCCYSFWCRIEIIDASIFNVLLGRMV